MLQREPVNGMDAMIGTVGSGTRDAVASARRTLELEIGGLEVLKAAIDDGLGAAFAKAVGAIHVSRGRVIVTGMGKSGHIGQKIAATLASTGTPAFFVHPGEASHGDLGMITRDDVILALSWSGETVELGNILTFSRRFGVVMIAITSRADSALGKASDIVLQLPVSQRCRAVAHLTSSAISARSSWSRGCAARTSRRAR